MDANGKVTAVGVGQAIITVYDSDNHAAQLTVEVVLFRPDTQPADPAVRYGDVNGDNSIDLKDVMTMRRVLAGWDIALDAAAADVNKDGSFDLKDVVRLRQYLAGGWDITL